MTDDMNRDELDDGAVDARLSDYANRWNAAQPRTASSPADRAARSVRWQPYAAAAAVVALAVGGAFALQSRRPGGGRTSIGPATDGGAAPTGSSSPRPTSDTSQPPDTTVPWANDPVPMTALSQHDVTPSPNPESPKCTAGQVKLDAKAYGDPKAAAGAGSAGIDVIATNISQQGCDITIKPGVSLRGGGARLPVDSVVTEEAKIGPTYLAPGKDAITQVFWGPHYCGPRPASYDVVLTWGDSEEHSVNVRDAVYPTCGDGGGNLSPGWFEVAQPSAMPVLPKIEPPLTVKRGETLHFRVSLVGTQQEPYVLDPCPAYAMALYPAEPNTAVSSADEHAFRLNCAAAPKQIDPGEAVTFEMQLDVPASMLLGRATLSWRMGYRGVDAKTEITVT